MQFKLFDVYSGLKWTNLVQTPVDKAQFELALNISKLVLLVIDFFY